MAKAAKRSTKKANTKKTARKKAASKKPVSKKVSTKAPARKKGTSRSRAKTGSEPARRLAARFDRKADNSLTPARAAAAASKPLPIDRDDPLARWYDDSLTHPNEFATIRDLIEGQAKRFGDKPFLIYEETGTEYSYIDLDAETSINVNLIRELGADDHARIGILDANTPDFVFLYTGCMKGAYTSAPLNYHLKAPELQFCLANSESQLLFVSSEYWGEIAKALKGIHEGDNTLNLNFLRAIAIIGDAPKKLSNKLITSLKDYRNAQKRRKKGDAPLLVDFQALRSNVKKTIPASHVKPKANTQGEIIYTSGTTGRPKGVILRHHQFLSDAKYIARWYRMTPDSRMGMVLPLFHVNAEVVTTMTPLVAGGSVVMFKKFSASRFWPAVEKYSIHIVSVVPTILSILISQEHELRSGAANAYELGKPSVAPLPKALAKFGPGTVGNGESIESGDKKALKKLKKKGAACAHDVSSLWTIICGAAPLPAEVQLEFERTFLIPITEGYGLSETTCYSTFNPIEGWRKVATIGVEVGNQVNIFGAKNKAMSVGEMGEIVIRGENVMQEYFKRPEANEQAFSGGWFHSGDVGDIDHDGFVRIRDRVKDMIIRGGENIYPREIDEVLYTHGEIENAATIGVPDKKYGEEVVSFVVLNGQRIPNDKEASKLESDIIAYCKERLADYKVPRAVRFVVEIPKGPTGKLLRRALRDLVGNG